MKTKDLKELTEQIETERDARWLDQMSLYFSSIKTFAEQEDVTVEKVVDQFYKEILKEVKSAEKPQEQLWGTVVLDIP